MHVWDSYGPLEGFRGLLRGLSGAFRGLLGASWGPPGAYWWLSWIILGRPEVILGSLGTALEPYWCLLPTDPRCWASLGPSWGSFGTLLRPSCRVLGPCQGSLGVFLEAALGTESSIRSRRGANEKQEITLRRTQSICTKWQDELANLVWMTLMQEPPFVLQATYLGCERVARLTRQQHTDEE